MPTLSTRPYIGDSLMLLDLDHPQLARPIGIIERRGAPENPVLGRFLEQLKRRHESMV